MILEMKNIGLKYNVGVAEIAIAYALAKILFQLLEQRKLRY
ncbi:MAG: hypothetical protein ACLRQF_04120 [Thomasclavelia ramosa]